MRRRKYRIWTSEELKYLEENAGNKTVAAICRKLKRSEDSVRMKAQRLGISVYVDFSEYLTFSQIDAAFNKTRGSVSKIWVRRGLKYKKLPSKCIVKHKDLVKFMKENQDLYTTIGTDNTLIWRESWFEEKHESDIKNFYTTKRVDWNAFEVGKLKRMYAAGSTISEMAREIGRSEAAVKNKLYKGGIADEALGIKPKDI